ncbi:MAG: helix-turn-helix domain-containing protein, partial [Treponema sp.]|nr:helix-turn-helix domain-containing protein [Treponema sp.]
GGASVKLSLKEFQIIELLFEAPHQVIKKERIIEKIWGGDSDAEYNNVEVYISFIRKKMDYLKVQTVIRTARGIGYSLEEGK